MVVEVVAEGLYVGYRLRTFLWQEVPGIEDYIPLAELYRDIT